MNVSNKPVKFQIDLSNIKREILDTKKHSEIIGYKFTFSFIYVTAFDMSHH